MPGRRFLVWTERKLEFHCRRRTLLAELIINQHNGWKPCLPPWSTKYVIVWNWETIVHQLLSFLSIKSWWFYFARYAANWAEIQWRVFKDNSIMASDYSLIARLSWSSRRQREAETWKLKSDTRSPGRNKPGSLADLPRLISEATWATADWRYRQSHLIAPALSDARLWGQIFWENWIILRVKSGDLSKAILWLIEYLAS